MRVFRDTDQLPEFNNSVVTIGTFDGVHLGHQKIIAQMKKEADRIGGETVIITFFPHPRKVVKEGSPAVLILTTLAEKISLLDSYGVDNVVVVAFDEKFSNQSASQYIEDFLWKKFRPKCVIIGYDHRFGHGRMGDYKLLESYGNSLGFEVKEIPQQVQNEISISSTKIREALLKGDIKTADNCLGHPYFFEGMVIKGNQLGRTIGFPTANLDTGDPEKLVPENGVYAVKVGLNGKQYLGMMNIGIRPTVGGTSRTIEVNILDFDKDIYGETLKIDVIAYLRGEQKFAGLDALKSQLAKDRESVRLLLD
ncbi:MAG: riboflavin biosynthesis protein RibF [Pseudopedobacter saltans]|uniref:Riboflavin biosynthesis protein n=1 Tax=Pseudopedobacter saltans TaxID=151895 RepID=A0A2W5EJ17_9SPHI|nr:MAG: riboflavin biosynthesis protein RibF [Pseudopedobacter saltans]